MRATQHSGRFTNSTGSHNDRKFDLEKADHIDKKRLELNQYWTCYGDDISFDDAEFRFYTENFKEMIDDINARAEKSRHLERRTSASKLISSKKNHARRRYFPNWKQRAERFRRTVKECIQ